MKKKGIIRYASEFFGRISLRLASDLSLCNKKDDVDRKTSIIIDNWIKEKGWTEDLTQEEVARRFNINSERLGRYFYAFSGKSFLSWRRELRIEEAKRLLLDNTSMPTALIGEAVGIPDKSNFRRQFKRITGYSPAEWRRLKQ